MPVPKPVPVPVMAAPVPVPVAEMLVPGVEEVAVAVAVVEVKGPLKTDSALRLPLLTRGDSDTP